MTLLLSTCIEPESAYLGLALKIKTFFDNPVIQDVERY